MDNLILSARNLCRSYDEGGSGKTVFKSASLDIRRGECVALLGESGSGKSTLLNLLGGIDRADAGEILLEGQRLDQMREPALTLFRRQTIGFIYQFFNLIPTLTVAENIDLPLELLDLSSSLRKTRINYWLQQIGLQHKADAFPDQLSGGEQQRVAIARALAPAPRLVLADEPTGNLDAATGRKLLRLLTSLAQRGDCSLILVTHSQEVAQAADRVLVIRDGRLAEDNGAEGW